MISPRVLTGWFFCLGLIAAGCSIIPASKTEPPAPAVTSTANATSTLITTTPTRPGETLMKPVSATSTLIPTTPTRLGETLMKPTSANLSRPADFSVSYHWQEGSVPPPYHYEYDIRIGPGFDGDVVFTPDYARKDVPVWTEKFVIAEDQLSALYALVNQEGILDQEWQTMANPPIGGSIQSLDVIANGKHVRVPGYPETRNAAGLSSVYNTIRALVPKQIWDGLVARRAQYQQDYSSKRP